MKFNPDPTYAGLRIQANALSSIAESRAVQIELLTQMLKKEHAKKRHVSQEELESERKANERLTCEVEWLETRLACEDFGQQLIDMRALLTKLADCYFTHRCEGMLELMMQADRLLKAAPPTSDERRQRCTCCRSGYESHPCPVHSP